MRLPSRYGGKLADLVERWGTKVLDAVRQEIEDLYPKIQLKKKAQRSNSSSRPATWRPIQRVRFTRLHICGLGRFRA